MPICRAASDIERYVLIPSSKAIFPGPKFECSVKSIRNRISGACFMIPLYLDHLGASLYEQRTTLVKTLRNGGCRGRIYLPLARVFYDGMTGKCPGNERGTQHGQP